MRCYCDSKNEEKKDMVRIIRNKDWPKPILGIIFTQKNEEKKDITIRIGKAHIGCYCHCEK